MDRDNSLLDQKDNGLKEGDKQTRLSNEDPLFYSMKKQNAEAKPVFKLVQSEDLRVNLIKS